jgi:hypothetical protein
MFVSRELRKQIIIERQVVTLTGIYRRETEAYIGLWSNTRDKGLKNVFS